MLFLALWFSSLSIAQVHRVYTLADYLSVPADSVQHLNLSKSKLTAIPTEVYAFRNLKILVLSGNKISRVEQDIGNLKNLESIDLNQNKLTTFPSYVCQLVALKQLSLAKNKIGSIPSCIQYFEKLESLDLFQTYLTDLPIEISKLSQLKYLDLRGMNFDVTFHEKWLALLKNTKVELDSPCNCLEKK